MSAVAAPAPPGLLGQVVALTARSVRRTLAQPALMAPPLIFPLVLFSINAVGLEAATEIPGFPTDSYVDFGIAFAFMQGALFATATAGTDLAKDIQTGFLSRLSLTPMRGAALVAGQLGGAVFVGLVQAVVFVLAGLVAGAELRAGPAGLLVLLVLVVLVVVAFGAIGALMALRTGSGESVQGLFPLLFVLLFLSSMSLPRDLIEQDWFRTVATYNPVSYLVEAVRSLWITGWDGEALLYGFLVAGGVTAIALAAMGGALRTRMERT